MARSINVAIETCDVVVLVIEASGLTTADRRLLEVLGDRVANTILVINKLDELHDRKDVLPLLQELSVLPCVAFVPVSARRGSNLERLVEAVFAGLPEGPPMYPVDMKTDRGDAFRSAELIREQLFAAIHQEVPYGLTVEIEHISKDANGRWLVHALIWLERESHKPIVIGKRGDRLKRVGTLARRGLAEMLGGPVHLELWVKVRAHWSDNEQELKRFGYDAR